MRRSGQSAGRFVPYFQSSGRYEFKMYGHMFVEDLQNAFAISRAQGATVAPKVELIGEGGDVKRGVRILHSVGRRRNRNQNDQEIVLDAIFELVKQLAWRGHANFEVVGESDSKEGLSLSQFTDIGLFLFPGFGIQVVPREDREHVGRSWSYQSSKKLWLLSIPKHLGGQCKYSKMIEKLDEYDPIFPKFMKENMRDAFNEAGFDRRVYRTQTLAFQARLTKDWGWGGRSSFEEISTEFFRITRRLDFLRAKVILVNYLFERTSALFKQLNIRVELRLSGIPSLDEIESTRSALYAGEIDFKQVYTFCDRL